MPLPSPSASSLLSLRYRTVRVGAFEIDLSAAELHRDGSVSRLPEHAFQVLLTLLEHRGEVVSREQLRQRLWQSDTFVDFEQGLNTAVKRLRDALNDSADNPHYIETIPRHGYRLIAPVETLQADPGTTRKSIGRIGFAILVVAAIICAAVFYWRQAVLQHFYPPKLHSLAVLPFENLSSTPEGEQFADALTEQLITELGHMDGLRVISHQSVMQYKHSNKPISQITRELQIESVVEGSVWRANGKIRVTTQLIQARPERHLWSEGYEREFRDLLKLQEEIARDISQDIRAALTTQQKNGGH